MTELRWRRNDYRSANFGRRWVGSCRDGLHPERANKNRGAESVLSYLLGLCELRQIGRIATQNVGKSATDSTRMALLQAQLGFRSQCKLFHPEGQPFWQLSAKPGPLYDLSAFPKADVAGAW